MSATTEQPKWHVGAAVRLPRAAFITCGISCEGWVDRVQVHGRTAEECGAMARLIAATLNAHEELHREAR